MASRFGQSSATLTMVAVNTPVADLVLTNLAYCSASDLQSFRVPNSSLILASVANDTFVVSLAYPFYVF